MSDDQQKPAENGRLAKMQAAAVALASGKSIRKTAADLGIGERTLYTWLSKPNFKKRISQLRDRMIDQAVGSLSKCMTAAVVGMSKLMKSANETTQFRAYKTILELGMKLRDFAELSERLDALENQLNSKQK